MGIETVIIAGLTAASAYSSLDKSRKDAKSIVREGELVAANKAKETNYKAAKLTSSFLNSGLTLEGTPMNVLDSVFNTGMDDIGQIRNNYNTKSKNTIAAGRTEAIKSIAQGAMSYGAGGGFGGGGSSGIASTPNQGWAFSNGTMQGTSTGSSMPWLNG